VSSEIPYRTPGAFRAAVDSKLKATAQQTARNFAELRREFLYQRFLARVFEKDSLWVLKGGIGLLTRLPGARHSRDIDLMHCQPFRPRPRRNFGRSAGATSTTTCASRLCAPYRSRSKTPSD
jgi:Nucleotidyl transferase AbiEii toxin, Type IV TA system